MLARSARLCAACDHGPLLQALGATAAPHTGRKFQRSAELDLWRRLRATYKLQAAGSAGWKAPTARQLCQQLWAFASSGDACCGAAAERAVLALLRERPGPAGQRSIDVGALDATATYALSSQGELCIVG
jgi:hypothetical protein